MTALIVVGVPFLYWYLSRNPGGGDVFLYAQAAKEFLAGKELYLTTWQDKPPLGILVYAIPQIIAPRSYGAIAFFLGVCLVIQGLMFLWTFRSDRLAALCCMVVVTLFPMTSLGFDWPSLQHFSNLFIAGNLLIGYRIVRDRQFTMGACTAVGLLTAAGFHVLQNAVVSCLVPLTGIFLCQVTWKRKVIGLALVTVTGIVFWSLVVLWLYAFGDIHGYFYTVFKYPMGYARAHGTAALLGLVVNGGGTFIPMLTVLFGGVLVGTRFRTVLLVLLATGILCCVLPRRESTHYWVNFFPYLTLIVGLGIMTFRPAVGHLKLVWAGALVGLLLPQTAVRVLEAYRMPVYPKYVEVANVVDSLTPSRATLFVCSLYHGEFIQFASRTPAANVYFSAFQLTPFWCNLLPKKIDVIASEYLASPPGVIVIKEEYLRLSVPEDQLPNPIKIFRLLTQNSSYSPVASTNGFVVFLQNPLFILPSISN